MTTAAKTAQGVDLEKVIVQILNTIDREREKEIISRRFGLYDRKETLEQIGELLGITRERVRQLEKAVITRLKQLSEDGKIDSLPEIEQAIIDILTTNGNVIRISNLAELIVGDGSKINQSRLIFVSLLAPNLSLVEENDIYFSSTGNKGVYSEKQITTKTNEIVEAIKAIGQPVSVGKLAKSVNNEDKATVQSLATVSKKLAHLNGKWGLNKWPTVNPKNIRDKIYVILSERGSHMHFNEISAAIKESDFKRKNVTTQAIHNELIKDKRFVLIGRGIYALSEWGYKKGTVSDIISEVLKDAGEPLHRDEIVKRVLKSRHVKETTILLNLQGKPQFKRVAKATYTLDESVLA
jgi:Holliday junction resolvasome RuvABC DNA-binding subunit